LRLGFFRGGDQPVFAVEVDKNTKAVAQIGDGVFGDIALGQENFAFFAAIEVEAEIGVFDNCQGVEAPDGSHGQYPQ